MRNQIFVLAKTDSVKATSNETESQSPDVVGVPRFPFVVET